nr:dehydrogenase orse [Quercus suber]
MSGNEAAWIDGAKSSLRVADIEMPRAGPGRVVIRNHAVAVNPVDWKVQDYGLIFKQWPNVLGEDVAGEVIEVGEGVEGFRKGDRVNAHAINLMTSEPADGGFALYTSVPATTTAKIPPSVTYAEAAVLPLAVDTAAVGLYSPETDGFFGLPYPSLTPVNIGKTLVVWGGSSSVGAVTIQLAVASGVKVVAIASQRNHDLCKKAGASEVLDYSTPSIVEDVVSAVKSVGGKFVGVYDAISLQDDSVKHSLAILERLSGGCLTTVLPPPTDVPANVKVGGIMGLGTVTYPIWREFLTAALGTGQMKCLPPPWVVGSGLQTIQQAMNENKKGVSGKKVVVEL